MIIKINDKGEGPKGRIGLFFQAQIWLMSLAGVEINFININLADNLAEILLNCSYQRTLKTAEWGMKAYYWLG